jgi:uncharacterized RDD family membrane protein YckC
MMNMMTGRLGVSTTEFIAVGAGIFLCCVAVAVVLAIGTNMVLKHINGDLD